MKKSMLSLVLVALSFQVGVSSTAEARLSNGAAFGIGAGVGFFGALLLGGLSRQDEYSRDHSYRGVYRNDAQVGINFRLNWSGDNYRGYHYIDHVDNFRVRGGNDWYRDGRDTQCRVVRSVVADPRTGQPLNNYQANYRDGYVCLGRDGRWEHVDQRDCHIVRIQPHPVYISQPQPRPIYHTAWNRPTFTGSYNQPRPTMYQPGNTYYTAPVRRNIVF